MQNRINMLIKKFEEVYDGNPWYGDSFKSILKDIDSKATLKKEKKGGHSIAEILAHIIGWREFFLSRLTGNDFKIEQEETFNWKRIDNNQETVWKSLLDTLEETQSRILNLLEKADDNLLDIPVHERNYNLEYLLEGVIQHDIYHFGQISLLKKSLNVVKKRYFSLQM
jgi:uncharacterized damage-inducible protein DinB